MFLALSDEELNESNIDLGAVTALLVAGIYYLVLHAKSTDTTFCEIRLNDPQCMQRIKQAINLILEKVYDSSSKGT